MNVFVTTFIGAAVIIVALFIFWLVGLLVAALCKAEPDEKPVPFIVFIGFCVCFVIVWTGIFAWLVGTAVVKVLPHG